MHRQVGKLLDEASAALSGVAFYVMQRFTPYADPVLLQYVKRTFVTIFPAEAATAARASRSRSSRRCRRRR